MKQLVVDVRGIPAKNRIPYKRAHAGPFLVGKGDSWDEAWFVDGRLQLKEGTKTIGKWVKIRNGRDQDRAAAAPGICIVEGGDWSIIPLENLIAARRDRPGTLFAYATTPAQAKVYLDTLEVGVDGIVLAPASPEDVEATQALIKAKGSQPSSPPAKAPAKEAKPAAKPKAPSPDETQAKQEIALVAAVITAMEDGGMGDRICVDCTSTFGPGEGLLVGSTARSFCLVHAETIETEYVRARPFRVNAGAVHSYVLAPGGKTRYLSELQAGSEVLVAGGKPRAARVGRSKLEQRPHLIVHWSGPSGAGSAVLQNAETIRLVQPNGKVLSITELAVGDEILIHEESAARHFGMPIDERLEER